VEVAIFVRVQSVADSFCDKTHFVKMHARGRCKEITFYVMDLVWASLRDVVEEVCKNVTRFPSTKIQIARQTLKSIEALHELGYIHRDIKPANFAVGLPPNDNVIYLLEFGIAKTYRESAGAHRIARESVAFMGTVRYASASALKRQEQSRRDDLEAWLYMMIQV
ncbi:hypothetical protein PMAYCL1PPCAC_00889, partial [Pristionchus mayeri]